MAVSTTAFERDKNRKAAAYTVAVCSLLFLLLWFFTYSLPVAPSPIVEEGIEVNLGNSDVGMGEDQPFLPGEPSPSNELAAYTPPADAGATAENQDVATDETDPEAAAVNTPKTVTPNRTISPSTNTIKNTNTTTINTTPAPPKPKATMGKISGNGNGGNDADLYKPGGNQGIMPGNGDMGRPGGNPDSDNYTGNGGTGKSGISVSRGLGNRKVVALPSFNDEFNQNGQVAVDVKFSPSGRAISSSFQPRGSSNYTANMREIALRRAKELKLNVDDNADEEQVVTFIFRFRLKQ